MPAAHEITILETLAMLDGEHAGLARGVARRDYVLWLGSGISLDRIVGVRGVIARVLDYLRERRDMANPQCRFNRALDEILEELTAPERALVDLDQPVAAWPADNSYAILTRLAGKYSQVLSTLLEGEDEEDFLLWTAVDVPNTFTTEDPDVEHLCIVMLALESAFNNISSANWDYLIEAAERELTGGNALLDVCIQAADFQAAGADVKLLKFHGCAALAATAPPIYRPLLIARLQQIVNYHNNASYGAMRHHLIGLIQQRRTLMIGFSAQDVDVQQMFMDAYQNSQWAWGNPPPAFVFAEDQLSQGQKLVLSSVYPNDYQANRVAIEASARCRAYGKPLLLALLLEVYALKLTALCDLAVPNWTDAARSALHAGIRRLRDKIASGAEPDRLAFTRLFVAIQSTVLHLYHAGRADPALPYHPITPTPLQRVSQLPASMGLRQAAVVMALLGNGDADGSWAVEAQAPAPDTPPITVRSGGRTTPIYVAANDEVAVKMMAEGIFDLEQNDAVLILSASPAGRQQRSPVRAPGRTGRQAMREVSMSGLLADSEDDTDMLELFKRAAAL